MPVRLLRLVGLIDRGILGVVVVCVKLPCLGYWQARAIHRIFFSRLQQLRCGFSVVSVCCQARPYCWADRCGHAGVEAAAELRVSVAAVSLPPTFVIGAAGLHQ